MGLEKGKKVSQAQRRPTRQARALLSAFGRLNAAPVEMALRVNSGRHNRSGKYPDGPHQYLLEDVCRHLPHPASDNRPCTRFGFLRTGSSWNAHTVHIRRRKDERGGIVPAASQNAPGWMGR